MAALGTQPCNEDVVNMLLEAFRANARTPAQIEALEYSRRTIAGLRRPGDEHQWVVPALDVLLRSMIRSGLGSVVDRTVGGSSCPSAQLNRTRLEALAPDNYWSR